MREATLDLAKAVQLDQPAAAETRKHTAELKNNLSVDQVEKVAQIHYNSNYTVMNCKF